ncbi:TPA: hypothetical protein BOS_11674 [Bos taurus]|nr:TPA: hypothetical protein BOS_11674 [Bos taurus]
MAQEILGIVPATTGSRGRTRPPRQLWNSRLAGGNSARHRREWVLPRTTPWLDAGPLPGFLILSGPTEGKMQGWGS